MDLDLRRVRNFVAVAEELHFGRAAQRLHIAQPALSRQIRALETDLGVTLFDRDRRTTTLTPAGRQLLADAPALLEGADAAARRARAAATSTLTIGFMPGITLTSLTRLLRDDHPELQVRLLRTDWDSQITVLRDGRADVSVVRLPVETDGITVHPWFSEPRVAVLPVHHPCADSTAIALAELAGDHLVQDADAVPEWRAVAEEFRSGPPAAVPEHHSVEEKLEAVAAGDGICVLPASTGHFYTRSDVAVVPIHDIAPNEVALAWPTSAPNPYLRSVIRASERIAPAS